VGKNPTDRGKQGTKRSLCLQRAAACRSVFAWRARTATTSSCSQGDYRKHRHRATPRPTVEEEEREQGMCLDKGYDYDEVREILAEFGFTAHIRARGEEAQAIKREAGYKARRWVVERTHSWMNRFRAILIRWEKKAANYLALLHLSCAYITFKQAGLLG
jgi:putative transposase